MKNRSMSPLRSRPWRDPLSRDAVTTRRLGAHKRRGAQGVVAVAISLCALASASEAAAPKVKQLIAFRDGSVSQKAVRAAATTVRVGGNRCGVAQGTALSVLLRSRAGKVGLEDFGNCTRRGRDGGGLFVNAIRGERNRGQDGWTYKVGTRAATAGAADPSGAFGNGTLRPGQRITWFYCRLRRGTCQRSLVLRFWFRGDNIVFDVRGYDDDGDDVPVAGATIPYGPARLTTDSLGRASTEKVVGDFTLRARKTGLVPSFPVRVVIR